MTAPVRAGVLRPRVVLSALALLAVVVAILTPEAPGSSRGGVSSLSTGPAGAGIMFELARRIGWRTERRMTPLDSTLGEPTVQVVLAPSGMLGAHEVHRLLANVRRGGGLIFAVDDGDEIADSLGLANGRPGRFVANYDDANCPGTSSRSLRERSLIAIPPEIHQIVWRRAAPSPPAVLASTQARVDGGLTVALGFRLGAGKVAVISSSAMFTNDAVRQCQWGADIALARVLEYVRPTDADHPRLVFDEYHHGFGMHGGSLSAVARYLSRTASGRFTAQALLAAAILLLAMAPRPIVPREPERIVRRSPLEHADALGHAYADVDAARTATSLLVGGLRRRAGRSIPGSVRRDDDAFLTAVADRFPETRSAVDTVRRALRQPAPPRELIAVADAVRTIEQHLTTTFSQHS